jgi:lysine/ornithine N-monooxygenase
VEVSVLSEELPDTLKLKLLKRAFHQVLKEREKPTEHFAEDPEKHVYAMSDEKAVELLGKIKLKYPEIYGVLIRELYKALKSGKISSISGMLIYDVINTLNLDVKPDIRIKFVKHGKEVDLKEYID